MNNVLYEYECNDCEFLFYTKAEFIPPNFPRCSVCGSFESISANGKKFNILHGENVIPFKLRK